MTRVTTLACMALAGCAANHPGTLFEQVPAGPAGIDFVNELTFDYDFNVYRYRNFYNGGGVALGDVNGDHWPDLFFTGNQVPNRLYLNRGDWTFEDVSERAGISGARAWSTGVSMADVNGDGWLDIYVCNSGIVAGDDHRNELFINQGDTTFVEQAQAYGLDDAGLSTHMTFVDYDRDGDLDAYLVNNSFRSIQDFDLEVNTRHIRHAAGGDRLFRNEHPEKRFVDVSEAAGVYGSEIGFGLGVSAGDVNRDGWVDLYISNDFFERDYLYVNNADGTFSETLTRSMSSTSAAAMGADMADLNGDGYPDIFVTDMLPHDEVRLKTVSSFDSWARYRAYVRDDYFHQFTRNTLHLGRGHPPHLVPAVQFSETGRMMRVEASDWSWGALIADLDHDGYRDIFVANGILRDLTNADYLVNIREKATFEALTDDNYVDWATLIDMIPTDAIPNHVFAGQADGTFVDQAAAWGLGQPGFSNGSAYADLDLDGDLDLVASNLNGPPLLYRNNATELHPHRDWIQFKLDGAAPNTQAVGTQISVWHAGRLWFVEQQPVRGFQSSVDPVLHLGLGAGVPMLDSVRIAWPNGANTALDRVVTGTRVSLPMPQQVSRESDQSPPASSPLLTPVDPESIGLHWRHMENEFSDFDQQPLLFHMRSTEGPAACTGDLNGDGRPDLYLGGAKDQPGYVAVQTDQGTFARWPAPEVEKDALSEDTDCAWFDVDGDGDADLYVASGGTEFPGSSSALLDRIYVNDGTGQFSRSDALSRVPMREYTPTGVVAPADFDGDGDVDLFVGARMRPFAYGMPAGGQLLVNDGTGTFTDATARLAPALTELGLLTDAAWADFDGDGDADLVVSGEWMPLVLLRNNSGTLVRMAAGLEHAQGWWQTLMPMDVDLDGDLDVIAGNHGLNSRFQAPVDLWVGDFDRNGSIEQIFARTVDGQQFPWHLRHDLIGQLPYLGLAYPTYASYAGQTVSDIFSPEDLRRAVHRQATELRSMVAINNGTGQFSLLPLPQEVQLSPMYAVAALQRTEGPWVLGGGNLYEVKPEAGRYDASYGNALDARTLAVVDWHESGFFVEGPVRHILTLDTDSRTLVLVVRNNDAPVLFAYQP